MKRALLGLVAGAVLTATAAVADNNDLPEVLQTPQANGASCVSLQRQFDAEIVTHANAPGAPSARERRRKGEQKCNNGRYEDGVKDLAKALRNIGVQPTMR